MNSDLGPIINMVTIWKFWTRKDEAKKESQWMEMEEKWSVGDLKINGTFFLIGKRTIAEIRWFLLRQ